MHSRSGIALFILCLALGGCSRTEPPSTTRDDKSTPAAQPPVAQVVAPAPPVEACSLLSSEEIAAVQGEAVVGTKPSLNQGRGLAIYDCFFTLPTFTNSISLSVTQAGTAADAQDPRRSWQEMLATANAKASEKSPPPRIVEGIGEQAFWTGNERMGALYVLHGPRYLRISVGGPGDQATKIEKCRSLAEAALKRL